MNQVTLLHKLLQIRSNAGNKAHARLSRFQAYFPDQKYPAGAFNLAYYLALREHDLRPLQEELISLGISSLGRGEAHIVDNLDKVIELLCKLTNNNDLLQKESQANLLVYTDGLNYLEAHTSDLLGKNHNKRRVRIMITIPEHAAENYHFIESLILSGMDCARINTAHDDKTVWLKIVEHIKLANKKHSHSCQILMDLGGQKVRTGNIESAPQVYHLKTKKDAFGKCVSPAQLLILSQSRFLTRNKYDKLEKLFYFAIDDEVQQSLKSGDTLMFRDYHGKQRKLEVVSRRSDGALLVQCQKNAFITPETTFNTKRSKNYDVKKLQQPVDILITDFRLYPAKIRVHQSDMLLLTQPGTEGKPARLDNEGNVISPATIPISQNIIFQCAKPGESVWIDDGKVCARVKQVSQETITLEITRVKPQGALIKSDKGINLPDMHLNLPALTEDDLQNLDFIACHADIVGFSFVQSKDDMLQLLQELDKRNASQLPVIAKIETAKAVKNLPEIILSSIGKTRLGIMIARGDLAIEIGSVRMAEMQEEILWLCEAAHIPVIWATQVLESLAKYGIRSRPEITDAAMSVRAECVMLNKGPYIMEALSVLNDILKRMQEHQRKKTSRLRALHQWKLDVEDDTAPEYLSQTPESVSQS